LERRCGLGVAEEPDQGRKDSDSVRDHSQDLHETPLKLDVSGRVVGQGAGQRKVDVRVELGGGLRKGGRPGAAEGGIAENGKEQATRPE